MKILHTADWHIGKKLHKTALSQDFDLFIDWLGLLLEKEGVDLLLVSGDIFDLANPSSEARNQYYRSLLKLRKLDCRIILTGGNHDSPAMLDAPGEILRELDIHIVGGLPEALDQVLIPVEGKDGQPEVVIAALPFLRDPDLRQVSQGVTYEDRLEATREGMHRIFSDTADLCRERFPGLPALAMGHLFAAGMETSESEREIQIGNQAAMDARLFGDYFSYVALGHIHKPQRVSGNIPIFYSGSPLPLSFSERKYEKRVLLIDTDHGWEPRNIPVPEFRKLLKISGSLDTLKTKLDALSEKKDLESFIEIELRELQYDAQKLFDLDALVTGFDTPGFRIVKYRAHFENQVRGASETFDASTQLEDLKPREVFQELIGVHDYDPETRQEILSAFDSLLEEVQSAESPQNS